MKGNILAKVGVVATILAEKSGLFVDFVTCDGASWNRNMWKRLGIIASAKSLKCKVQHPTDASRHPFFVSDLPHLIKCLRNSLLKMGFNTPAGHVIIQHVKEAHKIDSGNITLKAMPGITMCHTQPNGFEKMRVSYAFQLFGLKVIEAIYLYREKLECIWGSITPTELFFQIYSVICAMTSHYPAEALRPGSTQAHLLEDFLVYLNEWEAHAKKTGGFLSDSTANGLRVTITSVLETLSYLIEKAGFKYIMTSKTSQDPLENLFGIIRQSSWSNDDPMPTQFLLTISCLSFYGLVKTPSSYDSDDGFHLADLIGPSLGKSIEEIRDDEEHLKDLLLEEVSPVECDILAYVAGFLLRTIIKATGLNRTKFGSSRIHYRADHKLRKSAARLSDAVHGNSCGVPDATDGNSSRTARQALSPTGRIPASNQRRFLIGGFDLLADARGQKEL
ncbi:hypothetical protein HPB50_008196 [Hyalomma asiaticum]|uniref:Uncharacterized protein n=1 Tax=Hyalomma asiaticum TaxID=266040 RepID=A0ACB7SBU3_HYAAI|nr:hypothetical protein HPB50_008196 [Hyalomma asiaticum]